jgi:hypothetical protein
VKTRKLVFGLSQGHWALPKSKILPRRIKTRKTFELYARQLAFLAHLIYEPTWFPDLLKLKGLQS